MPLEAFSRGISLCLTGPGEMPTYAGGGLRNDARVEKKVARHPTVRLPRDEGGMPFHRPHLEVAMVRILQPLVVSVEDKKYILCSVSNDEDAVCSQCAVNGDDRVAATDACRELREYCGTSGYFQEYSV